MISFPPGNERKSIFCFYLPLDQEGQLGLENLADQELPNEKKIWN